MVGSLQGTVFGNIASWRALKRGPGDGGADEATEDLDQSES
jgi:hypothetical protein